MTGEFEHRNLSLVLLQTREAVMGLFRPLLNCYDITEQQWRVIRAVNDSESGEMEIGQVARECCILSPSLSGMLERMEASGLIMRRRVAADQRRVMVSLTPSSRALCKKLGPLVEERYRYLEDKVGRDTLADIYRLLDVVREALPPEVLAEAPSLPAKARRRKKPAA
ncbi:MULTISPECIES: homoprotocatechuate degradation operon regulator HpaR [Pandoraea]|jgi:homoprotocatechuate degradation regulator HpaR|uniref:MarR family transcriptional regulator n=1 Tax=Pandoraea pnomenusa TaxID=93220 RepID=A0A378YQC1_9BURK|nr:MULTISPECIES: homoprotocatechuate degradation operon regulator HpaR [Pandoraea]AHB07999.1 MarR family transcriptional regulator [Pandoraea pnomenusa 3kgm]AHB75804.1 homoprotocatechuate degradation operon regulator, HpaR [Pandoraea pnomenusa]AHN75878.1 MarR family transcriptional regulator [Pandoraea pnomenusa]AIU27534.1 MarR family transcriptional regulator [Pandoraea pnomenusa]ANC44671.1 MarR family transcriptional regulator [Pandoraea pnomenusa]